MHRAGIQSRWSLWALILIGIAALASDLFLCAGFSGCTVNHRCDAGPVVIVVRDKVPRQCPHTTTFEEKGEPKQIRTEVLLLISLTPYR